MSLFDTVTRWVAVTEQGRDCPECGAEMDDDYARDPPFQDHWRGSPAYVCPECDYAERKEA